MSYYEYDHGNPNWLEDEQKSKVEKSSLALGHMAQIKRIVLTSHMNNFSSISVPQHIQDAWQMIEDYHKARLYENSK